MSFKELKTRAKAQVGENYGFSILVLLTMNALIFVASYFFGLSILIMGPLAAGSTLFFLNISRGMKGKFVDLFSGFTNFGNTLVMGLLVWLFTFLWSLLLIVPGIIKACSYSMAPYVINDNPEMSGNEAIKESMRIMQGKKWRYFVLLLSFIGWGILSVLTFGILEILWVGPYRSATMANFYESIKYGEYGKQINTESNSEVSF